LSLVAKNRRGALGCGFFLDLDGRPKHAFRFAAPDRQKTMGGQRREFLAKVVVHLELGRLFRLFGYGSAREDAFFAKLVANEGTKVGMLGDNFGDDVTCASQCRFDVGNSLLRVDERCGLGGGIARGGLLQDPIGEGFEAALASYHGAGSPLRLVRKIDVFERRFDPARLDLRSELLGELALRFDFLEDRLPSLDELEQVRSLLLDRANLNLVGAVRLFLSVAGDERNASSFLQQPHDGLHTRQRKL
jgi:hypothetical protein